VIEVEQTEKKTVLIVDDEPAVRKLVQKMLSKNYIVIEAQDGADAINIACSYRPDITLIDMMMSKMDGLSACYAINTNQVTREIPVVMLTAIGYELNKKLSEDVMCAKGYITKPFNSRVLLETIRRLLPNG
jgi:two-component system alkaline phosphatase synthesis response regulator PhoP